jgi:hypothetical protein
LGNRDTECASRVHVDGQFDCVGCAIGRSKATRIARRVITRLRDCCDRATHLHLPRRSSVRLPAAGPQCVLGGVLVVQTREGMVQQWRGPRNTAKEGTAGTRRRHAEHRARLLAKCAFGPKRPNARALGVGRAVRQRMRSRARGTKYGSGSLAAVTEVPLPGRSGTRPTR